MLQELAVKFGLDCLGVRRRDTPAAEFNDRKSRELYVGSLTMGAVTSQMLVALFTEPLASLRSRRGRQAYR